jgi:uncharacterized membrane protein YdjX (TVP38/TMEM64 family)
MTKVMPSALPPRQPKTCPESTHRQIKSVRSAASLDRMKRTRDSHIKELPMKRYAKKPVLVALLVLAVVGGGLALTDWGSLWEGAQEVFTSPKALREFVLGFGAWAPAMFFIVQVFQVILAPIPGGATVVVGTLLFGPWGGLALSLLGGVVGSVVVFLVVRRWGKPLTLRLVGKETFEKYVGVFDAGGWWLFVIMLVPFLPDDAVSALAGLSALSLRRFTVLVAVGRLPSWALTGFITADLMNRSAAAWVTVGLAVAAVAAVGGLAAAAPGELAAAARGQQGRDRAGKRRHAVPCRLCVTRHNIWWGAYGFPGGDGSFRLAMPGLFGGVRGRGFAVLAHRRGVLVLPVWGEAGRRRRVCGGAALSAGDPGAVARDAAAPAAGMARGG